MGRAKMQREGAEGHMRAGDQEAEWPRDDSRNVPERLDEWLVRYCRACDLRYQAGNLLHLRRGLYATVPRGTPAENAQVDPYRLATKLTEEVSGC